MVHSKGKRVLIGNCPLRKRRKEERPAEIVAAARDAFLSDGFAATRVEDIARGAGVSKGTVYLYYPTKEALFEAVVRADVLPVIEGVKAAILADESTPAIQQLRLIGDTMYRELAGTERRRILHLVIAEGPRFPWLTEFYHREILSKGQELIRVVLQRGAERGEFDPGKLEQFPEILMAPTIVAALFQLLFSRHRPFDLDAYRDAHIELVLRALGADSEAKPAGENE